MTESLIILTKLTTKILFTDSSSPLQRSTHTYQQIKMKTLEEWSKVLPSLVQTAFKLNYPLTFKCCQCKLTERELKSLYRCLDCGPSRYSCSPCLAKAHYNPHLHVFDMFAVSTDTHIYSQESPVWRRMDGHQWYSILRTYCNHWWQINCFIDIESFWIEWMIDWLVGVDAMTVLRISG